MFRAATYNFRLARANKLRHQILASGPQLGIRCFITREDGEEEGQVDMQVSRPMAAFFGDEPKLVMSIEAYINLLHFFHTEYSILEKRMIHDHQNMKEQTEWMLLNPFLSFCELADIHFGIGITETLRLEITKKAIDGNMPATLKDEGGASLVFTPETMKILSHDLPLLREVLHYKKEGQDLTLY